MKVPWTQRVWISDAARSTIETAAAAALPDETGGILVGWLDHDGLHVTAAHVVTDLRAGRTSYVRRSATAQEVLDRALASEPAGSPVGYVGEWHSHPGPSGPSRQDLRTMRSFSADVEHRLALVVLRYDGGRWTPAVRVVNRWVTWNAELR